MKEQQARGQAGIPLPAGMILSGSFEATLSLTKIMKSLFLARVF